MVVPFYDVEAYLGECLDSVLAQSFKDFEVLLVDDGDAPGAAVGGLAQLSREAEAPLVQRAELAELSVGRAGRERVQRLFSWRAVAAATAAAYERTIRDYRAERDDIKSASGASEESTSADR